MLLESSAPDPITALVQAARRGESRAWEQLHAQFAPTVHAIALARGPVSQPHDVVQESFARALEKLAGLRDDAAFGPWLMTIARNLATSQLRRQQRWGALPRILRFDPRPTSEAQQALDAIRALPEAYSELMMMRLVEGMTGPEIAERLDRTPGSVRVSLHRGMALLRERLGVTT